MLKCIYTPLFVFGHSIFILSGLETFTPCGYDSSQFCSDSRMYSSLAMIERYAVITVANVKLTSFFDVILCFGVILFISLIMLYNISVVYNNITFI